ncbi:BolA family transcriptional regulator [archaeon]|nr:MAG: BolA family transcriptional regulator [archaeon]
MTTAQRLRHVLDESLGPLPHCELINESHMHNVPKGSETHFKLIIVSNAFENLPLVQRHRKVFHVVNKELQANGGTIHALSITAKTTAEWDAIQSEGGLR